MPKKLSAIAWLVGAVLAAVVVFGGIRTSSARFGGATENRANLWQSAALAVDVSGTQASTTDLFLDGTNLYPGVRLENCVAVSAETSLENVRVRLHGARIAAPAEAGAGGDLGPYLTVAIERGRSQGGCTTFQPTEQLFSGTLDQLTAAHASFESGLILNTVSAGTTYLRFTGEVEDTNDAQGLAAEYVMHIEVRP